ncbi:MAG: hypothetical protein V4485_01820 [Pseudomonadota bacterium]
MQEQHTQTSQSTNPSNQRHTMGAQGFLIYKTHNELQQDQLKIIFVHKQPYPGLEKGWNYDAFDCVGGEVQVSESREEGLRRGIESKLGVTIDHAMTLGELHRVGEGRNNDTLTIFVAWLQEGTDLSQIQPDTSRVREIHEMNLHQENGEWKIPSDGSIHNLYPLYSMFIPKLLDVLNNRPTDSVTLYKQRDHESGQMDVTIYNLEQTKASDWRPNQEHDSNAIWQYTDEHLGPHYSIQLVGDAELSDAVS